MFKTNAVLRQFEAALQTRNEENVQLSDRFEIVAAASKAEEICPNWINDNQRKREQDA